MFAYDIVAEGKEPLGFYEMFGEKTDYKVDFPSKVSYKLNMCPKVIHNFVDTGSDMPKSYKLSRPTATGPHYQEEVWSSKRSSPI